MIYRKHFTVPDLRNGAAGTERFFMKEQLMKTSIRTLKSVAVALVVLIALPFMIGAYAVRNFVTIRDDGGRPVTVFSNSEDPLVILKEAGIQLGDYDDFTFEERHNNVYRLNIRRAFNVKLTCDGTTRDVPILEGTVADVLKRAGITLGEEDIVTPALTETVTPQTKVKVQRVTYGTSVTTEAIPYETIEQHTPLLKNGKTRVLTEGVNGEQTTTTVSRYIDGVYAETVSVTTEVTKEPSSATVMVGDKTATITTLEVPEDLVLDANGNPVNYTQKIVGKATAYSARSGAKTASGRYAIPGHVAVNPNVIPYGSKLYIKSADGSFIYGYAVAADTGIALMDGRVTVDLFFDTYLESCLFGAKTMEIYVIG